MGYKYQFITLAGIHSMWFNMFDLAHAYAQGEGMRHYVEKVQQPEFAAGPEGYTFVSHQQEVGTGYFDKVTTIIGRRLVGDGADRLDRRRSVLSHARWHDAHRACEGSRPDKRAPSGLTWYRMGSSMTRGLELLIAQTILQGFDAQYGRFLEVTSGAQQRFEQADWHAVQQAMKQRIHLYDHHVGLVVEQLRCITEGKSTDADFCCG